MHAWLKATNVEAIEEIGTRQGNPLCAGTLAGAYGWQQELPVRRAGIYPEAYMAEVLRRVADHPIKRIGNSCPGTSSRGLRRMSRRRDTQNHLNRKMTA